VADAETTAALAAKPVTVSAGYTTSPGELFRAPRSWVEHTELRAAFESLR
jgi:hypothetical protein